MYQFFFNEMESGDFAVSSDHTGTDIPAGTSPVPEHPLETKQVGGKKKDKGQVKVVKVAGALPV